MDKLTIVSINIRGLRDKKKRCTLIQWLRRKKFDIVCLQETFITTEILSDIEKDFHDLGAYFSSCSDSAHSRGVGILLSKKIGNWNVDSVHRDVEGRKILLNIRNLNNELISITSLYVPNNLNLRIQFISECNDWLQSHASEIHKTVIVGDFNTCYIESDRASGKVDK